MTRHLRSVLAASCVLVNACSPVSGGAFSEPVDTGAPESASEAGADAKGGCFVDADCGEGARCGYLESAGCAAKGQCFPFSGAICQSYLPGCACDGTMVDLICTGLPAGYTSKPLAHTGMCADAGCDGGYVCLSPVTCASDADCLKLGSKCDACTKLCGCGEADAGGCCPSGWSMYACSFPTGGSGLACHDPALGCASSTICGEGCDAVVNGRCGGG